MTQFTALEPDEPGIHGGPPLEPPLLPDEEVARLYHGHVYEDAKMTERARLNRADLLAVARAIARQMQGPKDGAIICNFDRAVEIILDAMRYAAGERTTQFGLGRDTSAARAARR